jgi:hypothetical protein
MDSKEEVKSLNIENRDIITIFENINNEIELALNTKNFFKNMYGRGHAKIVIQDTHRVLRNEENISQIYDLLIKEDPKKAIMLMGLYYKIGKALDKKDFSSIENFLLKKRNWGIIIREENTITNEIYPIICDLGLEMKIKNLGINIKLRGVEYPSIAPKMNIKFKNKPNLCLSIDESLANKLIDSSYSKDSHAPDSIKRDFNECLKFFEEEIGAIQ